MMGIIKKKNKKNEDNNYKNIGYIYSKFEVNYNNINLFFGIFQKYHLLLTIIFYF